jgi:hypothetical protein
MNLPLDRIEAVAKSNKSTLYHILVEYHDSLRPILSAKVRPNYKGLAEVFGELGYLDYEGNPPSDRTLKRTWRQVKSMFDERRKAERNKVKPDVWVVNADADKSMMPAKEAASMDAIREMLRGNK